MNLYLFKSQRLGFRTWTFEDVEKLNEINCDPKVMEHFPTIKTIIQTKDFITKMQKQFSEKGFCYFAIDKLEDGKFIGFIGISEQSIEPDMPSFIDIGWRLNSNEWNNGYATEGAKKCLDFAFNNLNILKINAIAPIVNVKSEHVMIKIGMSKVRNFIHPKLIENDRLKMCVLYEIIK